MKIYTTASWSTSEETQELGSYCMHSRACHSSCRVPSKELKVAVATAVLHYMSPK